MIHATLGVIAERPDGLEATLSQAQYFRDVVVVAGPEDGVLALVDGVADQLIFCPADRSDLVLPALLTRAAYSWVILLKAGEQLHTDFLAHAMVIMEEAALRGCNTLMAWTAEGFEPRLLQRGAGQGQAGKLNPDIPFLVGVEVPT